MKRDLFVFAGQSNMMGAAVYAPSMALDIKDSYEYKHKNKRLGAPTGLFKLSGYPVGEFSYSDIKSAYAAEMINEKQESLLSDYAKNTYFCPAMSNLKSDAEKTLFPFSAFSEATAKHGATLAPFISKEWEKLGNRCAYAHIAKGGVSIDYYLTDEMASEYASRLEIYNKKAGTNFPVLIPSANQMAGAAEYFFQKCEDFFTDAKERFKEDELSNKCFFWLQGESDTNLSADEYEIKLSVIWDKLKEVGFTHFFCIRVDFFGVNRITNVMQAQESFVSKHSDAYMLTRAASYFTYVGQNETDWFTSPPDEEMRKCRDSYYGFKNQHINEKGFSIIAKHAIKNLYRVLIQNEEPVLEEEMVQLLIPKEQQRR